MSVTSTRKVSSSLSYSSSARGVYGAGHGRQSFVETIDTSNNVSIGEEKDARGGAYASQKEQEVEKSLEQGAQTSEKSLHEQSFNSQVPLSPLLDNDEDLSLPSSHKSVGIYGNNQEISSSRDEKVDNPYLKHFYENNEVVEDVDELV